MSNESLDLLLPDPVILAIETATRAGSVALARGEKLLAAKRGDALSSHSTDLIENIDGVLKEAGLELRSVDLFAAASGPGSFTGLRIGLATVKSLAVARERHCLGVPTLAAIAHAAGVSELLVAMLPAGRGEVFAQMFAVRANSVDALDEPAHLSPQALLARYGGHRRLTWAGEGANAQLEFLRSEALARGIKLRMDLNEADNDGWIVAAANPRLAESVAALGLRAWRKGNATDPANLHANYVRPSDAEIKTHA